MERDKPQALRRKEGRGRDGKERDDLPNSVNKGL